jgi:Mg2+ and Co2+ transporter CorA
MRDGSSFAYSSRRSVSSKSRRSDNSIKITVQPPLESENGPARDNRLRSEKVEPPEDTGSRESLVPVKFQSLCVFMMADGTVISIHPDSDLELTRPISQLTTNTGTIMRNSDASLIIQLLIHHVVNMALQVIEAYATETLALEREVLRKPSLNAVKHLHILQDDLILIRRTMEPMKALIQCLIEEDPTQLAALVGAVRVESSRDSTMKAYMGDKAKLYLADVNDHTEYILTSLETFAAVADNLLEYTFNMSSNQMNVDMKQLTLATVIFLPLSLLTGYFVTCYSPSCFLLEIDYFAYMAGYEF